MGYTAEINRANPTCLLFLIDQSGSMGEPFGGESRRSKAEEVTDAINRLLKNLVIKCTKKDGIRDYFHVGVIGYGIRVASALGGTLAGRELTPISTVAVKPLRLEERVEKVRDRSGALVEKSVRFAVWCEPTAHGKTPMCEALTRAHNVVGEFVARYPHGFPPIVLNLTDGLATDGNPEPLAQNLWRLATTDGTALLFNAHLSVRAHQTVEFPDNEAMLPDDYGRRLFRMSSPLPPIFQASVRAEGMNIAPGARGFVYNAGFTTLHKFFDIGTHHILQMAAGGK
jgi:hypothetical protein